MNYINWKHPEVEKLLFDYIENRPEALSQSRIARAVSVILNRDVKASTVQWRISSMRRQQSKPQQQNQSTMFSISAPYSRNVSKELEISLVSELDAFMVKVNEIENGMNAFLSSIKQASATLKNSFASSENIADTLKPNVNLKNQESLKLQLKPPQPIEISYVSNSAQHLSDVQKQKMPFNEMSNLLNGATGTMNQFQHRTNVLKSNPMTHSEIMNKFFSSSDNFLVKSKSNENLKDPQINGQLGLKPALKKILFKAGLNSKLYTCLLLETQEGKIYEYSFVFEENGIKHYKCDHCFNFYSSNKNGGSRLIVFVNGTINVGEHLSTCTPQTKFLSDVVQKCRQERVAAAQSHHLFENDLEIVGRNFCGLRAKDGIPNAELIIHNNFKYYYEKSQNIYFCYECRNVTAKIHFKEGGNSEMYLTLGKNAHRCHK